MSDLRNNRPRVIGGVVIGRHSDSRTGLVWGAFIALVGVALLLDHMGFLSVDIRRFWPVLIIFLGISNLFCGSSNSRSNRAFGVSLILLGAIFQLNALGITHLRFADLWPLAIIFVGLLLMWGAVKSPVVVVSHSVPESSDALNVVAIFGGAERRITSRAFKGGRVTAIFGGVELDFRDADIEGDKAVLEVNCIFGGVEIRVPASWHVDSRSLPILGGFSDRTRLAGVQDSVQPGPKTLVVNGSVILGGVETRN
jgi:predicted membrane protein